MMSIEQPAFPTWVNKQDMTSGMTLRDFFATAAMQGMVSAEINTNNVWSLAKDAYKIADAMLTVRKE
jgi:hypothetical protein